MYYYDCRTFALSQHFPMKHIYTVILPLCQDLGLENKIILQEIIFKWHIIFGTPISKHTYPAELKDGELIINVDSPVWLQQLRFMQPLLIEKLGDYAIKSVKLKIGKVKRDKFKKEFSKTSAVLRNPSYEISNHDADWLSETLSNIKDTEIREIIGKIILKSISRIKDKDSFKNS